MSQSTLYYPPQWTDPLSVCASTFVRTLLEKHVEELQQQVAGLKVKEATLTESNAEVDQRFQELNARLTDVETEHRKTKEEVRDSTSKKG